MLLGEPLDDGVVLLRPPVSTDRVALLGMHDVEAERFLGAADSAPAPLACIEVAGVVVGWIDIDRDREWLSPGEVNVGYVIHPDHRGCGYASRALELLVRIGLATEEFRAATLLIDPANARSLGVAGSTAFLPDGDIDGQLLFRRADPRPGVVG